MKVKAPGKLILSGEHAVLYGSPAIAMAVNRYVTVTITQANTPFVHFDFADISHRSHLSSKALHHLKERIKNKYFQFIRGEIGIRRVLQKPFELAQVAFGLASETFNLSFPQGVNIHVQSDIPIGCGMGSSAATILSIMQAISAYLEKPLDSEALYRAALQAENLQHGYSSGLDLRVALQGGCLYFHEQQVESRTLASEQILLVNTGAPESTTGQCVEKAATAFKSSSLSDDFKAVTCAMNEALTMHQADNLHYAVRENHRLLTTLGVVPTAVQDFIAQIEKQGGSAKICGAGSVKGEAGGCVWVVPSENSVDFPTLLARYPYESLSLTAESRGVYVV